MIAPPETEDMSQHTHEESVDSQNMDEDDADRTMVRRSERDRRLTEKALQNKIQDLTKAFWKGQTKYAAEIIKAESRLHEHCTDEVLKELKVNLELGHDRVLALFEEIRKASDSAPEYAIRASIDRLKADKDLLTAAAQLRMTEEDDNLSRTSARSEARHGYSPPESIESSRHSKQSRSSTSSKRKEAEAEAAARRAELEAERERAQLEEDLKRIEMEMERKKRQIEQQRIEKLLRMEEAKIQAYKDFGLVYWGLTPQQQPGSYQGIQGR